MKTTALADRLRASIRDIPDFPKPGILFKDITPVLLDPELFRATVGALADWTAGHDAHKVVGVDARGFLFAGAVADRLGLGLVPARKPGKLPSETIRASYDLEYGVNALEVHRDAIEPGERIVIVDDLLATGGTMQACCDLVRKLGGKIAGIAVLIELTGLGGGKKLAPLPVHSVVKYE